MHRELALKWTFTDLLVSSLRSPARGNVGQESLHHQGSHASTAKVQMQDFHFRQEVDSISLNFTKI